MKRILLFTTITLILYSYAFAQQNVLKIEKIRIGNTCDFSLRRKFELNFKTNKIYRITTEANYLHIRGLKFKSRIKIPKSKRKEIFILAKKIDWVSINKIMSSYTDFDNYYELEIFFTNGTSCNNVFPKGITPSDFVELFKKITEAY